MNALPAIRSVLLPLAALGRWKRKPKQPVASTVASVTTLPTQQCIGWVVKDTSKKPATQVVTQTLHEDLVGHAITDLSDSYEMLPAASELRAQHEGFDFLFSIALERDRTDLWMKVTISKKDGTLAEGIFSRMLSVSDCEQAIVSLRLMPWLRKQGLYALPPPAPKQD